MHWRIANEVARIEAKYPNALTAKELYDLLDHFKYIVPQGSPMTGIGNDYQDVYKRQAVLCSPMWLHGTGCAE